MENTVYVTGHKNPDTDSICAAIAYASFKKEMGEKNVIPVRLGNLNRETQFVMDYFDAEVPKYIDTVRLRVEDLNYDRISPVKKDISIKKAWELMKDNDINSLSVVDENGKLLGIVSLTNVTKVYMDVWDNTILGESNASIKNIIDTIAGRIIHLPKSIRSFSGKIVALDMKASSMDGRLKSGDIAICGDFRDTHELAIKNNVSLIILTSGSDMDKELVEKAKEKDITVISTEKDSFVTSSIITQSIPVEYVMTKDDVVSFRLNELLDDVKAELSNTRYRTYPIVDNKNKVVGSLSRYHLISKTRKKVILVDHNERGQSVDGLEEAEILEIIDHHRVANIATKNPIFFRNQPLGSTSTIIGLMYFENDIEPSKKIAGLLSSAIISDTLLFRSPTSTDVDKRVLKKLAKIAQIDPEEYAMEMFKAGTSLDGKKSEEILNEDFKKFEINGKKVGVGQTYTMDSESLKDRKEDLINIMEETLDSEAYDILVLALTDIFNKSSELIITGKYKNIIAQEFNQEIENSSIYAEGVVSRKKQIIPPLTNAINNIDE